MQKIKINASANKVLKELNKTKLVFPKLTKKEKKEFQNEWDIMDSLKSLRPKTGPFKGQRHRIAIQKADPMIFFKKYKIAIFDYPKELRLGQFMWNFMIELVAGHYTGKNIDPFYMQDEELLKRIDDYNDKLRTS